MKPNKKPISWTVGDGHIRAVYTYWQTIFIAGKKIGAWQFGLGSGNGLRMVGCRIKKGEDYD